MKNLLKYPTLIFTSIILLNCSSNDDNDCFKTITIPQFYYINNHVYNYNITQEVPCDLLESDKAIQIAPPSLKGFTYEVLNFVFTPNTGNNSSRLQFSIKLNNPTNNAVNGIAILTMNNDGIEYTVNYPNSCNQIGANSSCIFNYDKESSLDLGVSNSIKLIKVDYYLTNN